MGMDVELSTIEKPDMALIRNAYGTGIDGDVKKIRTLNILEKYHPRSYSVTINTHGDMLPFYHKDFHQEECDHILSLSYCKLPDRLR